MNNHSFFSSKPLFIFNISCSRCLSCSAYAIYSDCGDSLSLKNGNSAELKTKSLNIKTSSVSIINDSCELIDILSTLCNLLANDKTNTLLGPQPLLAAAQYAILKQKIDSFKGEKDDAQ